MCGGILRAVIWMPKPPVVPSVSSLFVVALVIYGIAVAAAVIQVPPTDKWEDTVKALGVAVAVATGIFGPISSIILARFQAHIASVSAQELERLKAALSTSLEVNKALIAGRVRAFDAMLTAAHFLYFAIRKQVFRGSEGDIAIEREADRRAAEASSVVWLLSKADRQLWFDVYQSAIFLLDEIRGQPDDKRHAAFNELGPELGASIERLQEAGLKAVEEADRQRVKTSIVTN
jgi:hypothetical protein